MIILQKRNVNFSLTGTIIAYVELYHDVISSARKFLVTYLGWFAMSPLPRLHHHDIMTIVGLFSILTFVQLLHRATTKFFLTLLHREKKKEGKNSIP